MKFGLLALAAAIFVGALVAFASGYPDGETDVRARTAEGTPGSPVVASVYDGDTLTMTDGTRVRLLQVDAPERKPVECWGREAGAELRKLVGKSVRLVSDPALDKVDRYGRRLAYVFVGRVNMNVRLVQLGAATPYFFRRERGRYAEALMGAARYAMAQPVGLWLGCEAKLDPYRAATTRFKGRP
jgi:micrococcal nuclease